MSPELRRIQRRLDRWELEHLREHAAALAAQVEDLERRLQAAESSADFWWQQVEQLREELPDVAQLGLTVEGALHLVECIPDNVGIEPPERSARMTG